MPINKRRKRKQKSKNIGSVTQTESKESTDNALNIKNVESMMLDVDSEFLNVFKLSFGIFSTTEKKFVTKKINKNIKAIENEVNKLFCYIINHDNRKFCNILALAGSYLFLTRVILMNDIKEEKLHVSEDYLFKCLCLLEKDKFDYRAIVLVMETFMLLIDVMKELRDLRRYEQYLHEAIEFYLIYEQKMNNDSLSPIDILNYFGIYGENKETSIFIMEQMYLKVVNNLECFFIANFNSMNLDKTVFYLHNTYDISFMDAIKDKEKHLAWAERFAIMSSYFIKHRRFTEARNYLRAASYMIHQFRLEYLKVNDPNLKPLLYHKYEQMNTTIYEFYLLYGIEMLRLSRNREIEIQNEKDDIHYEANNLKPKTEEQSIKLLISFIEEESKEYPLIPDSYPLNYNDAKQIFSNLFKWYNLVKKFYSLSESKINYLNNTNVILDGYKYYTYYVENKDEQIYIYEQQIKILEDIIMKLNSKDSEDICHYRYFRCKLANVYTTLLNIKTEQLSIYTTPSTNVSKEIEQLVENILLNYEFIINDKSHSN